VSFAARVRRWHWGKIVIVWAWGGLFTALLLGAFVSGPAAANPGFATFALFTSLALLIALTSMTWIWLGGKEPASRND
jgi:hypothetical protein